LTHVINFNISLKQSYWQAIFEDDFVLMDPGSIKAGEA